MVPHLDGEIRDGRHHMQVRVYYEDTDFSGIDYHANYLRFMERGRTNHLRLMGAEQHALFAEAASETPSFAFVVRSMKLDFFKKVSTCSGEANRAVPLVGRVWLGPAR